MPPAGGNSPCPAPKERDGLTLRGTLRGGLGTPQELGCDGENQVGYGQDQHLVERLIDGCELAWQEFVTRYAGIVRSRVVGVAGASGCLADVPLIDDLVAEVFAALLNNNSAALRAYAGRSSLSTYLCVIATRVAIRKAIRKSQPGQADLSEVEDTQQHATVDSVSDAEQVARLRESISRLPEKQRAVVQMYHLDGMAYEQISQALNIPVGSVGPTLKRAQEKLRHSMGEP